MKLSYVAILCGLNLFWTIDVKAQSETWGAFKNLFKQKIEQSKIENKPVEPRVEPAKTSVPKSPPSTNSSVNKPSSCTCLQNLISNGGFESPGLSRGAWSQYSKISGWVVNTGEKIEIQNEAAGSSYEGDQFAELDSDKSASISQTFTTKLGEKYTLKFAFAARPRSTKEQNILIVKWNGQEVGKYQKAGAKNLNNKSVTNWEVHEIELTGIDGASKIEFLDGGESNSIGTYLDDVSICKK